MPLTKGDIPDLLLPGLKTELHGDFYTPEAGLARLLSRFSEEVVISSLILGESLTKVRKEVDKHCKSCGKN